MSDDQDEFDKLPTASEDAPAQAREQAQEYGSVFAPVTLTLKGVGTVEIPPHPNLRLLDDDKLQAYDELLFEVRSYDREDDVVVGEQKVYDDAGNVITTIPQQVRRGRVIIPYQKDDVLITPSWEIRVVKTVLGDEAYEKLRKGGKSAADVWRIWNRQTIEAEERRAADSKSAGGAVDMASVPKADSK